MVQGQFQLGRCIEFIQGKLAEFEEIDVEVETKPSSSPDIDTHTHTHTHTYTLNGRLSLRVMEHIYIPLRVNARDPRCARGTSFLLGTMLQRLAPAVLSACGAWRLGCLVPAALGDCSAWCLRRLAPSSV